jgi:putative hydrolase of the HAD superfamily
VIFDLGGVVMPSPMDAFRAYEQRAGLPHRFISEVIVNSGDDGAWARLERGQLTLSEFGYEFEVECTTAGNAIDSEAVLAALHSGHEPRAAMLEAIARIREAGLKTAALTNNWVLDDAVDGRERGLPLEDIFHVVVESSLVGLRKPDPRIYELVCDKLGVEPTDAVFLDDLGVNLKPARAMGMTTIKVADPSEALAELQDVLGFALTAPALHPQRPGA